MRPERIKSVREETDKTKKEGGLSRRGGAALLYTFTMEAFSAAENRMHRAHQEISGGVAIQEKMALEHKPPVYRLPRKCRERNQ